jgi:hypothetical protein
MVILTEPEGGDLFVLVFRIFHQNCRVQSPKKVDDMNVPILCSVVGGKPVRPPS